MSTGPADNGWMPIQLIASMIAFLITFFRQWIAQGSTRPTISSQRSLEFERFTANGYIRVKIEASTRKTPPRNSGVRALPPPRGVPIRRAPQGG
jgi:hypothetical protein